MAIHRVLRPLACALLAAGMVSPPVAYGQWVLDGIPVSKAPGVQRDPDVVPDGSGGAVVFWIDRRTAGTRDVYAQRLTPDGRIAPGWPVNGVFLSGRIGELGPPVGIPDGTGGAIVVWEDERDLQTSLHDTYAQRVTGDGTIAPGWPIDGLPVCTATGDQRDPRVVSDGFGGAYITWYDRRDDPGGNPSPDIYAQRVTADGAIAPGWPVDGIAICTTPDEQWEPTLAIDGTGGAIISWYDGRNLATTGGDIFAQRIMPSGEIAPGWVSGGVAVCTAPGHQVVPETVPDGEGGALVVWLDGRTDPDWDVYAQRITQDGSLAPGWPAEGVPLSTASGYQFFLSAAADGLGGAVVAWEDYTNPTASDIFAQRITAEGVIPPGWPPNGLPVCTAPNYQIYSDLAPDGAGGAFVTWADPRLGGPHIYAQHVLASGAIAPGWEPNGRAVCTAPSNQTRPAIAADGLGGAILAWEDFRDDTTSLDIYAHKLGIDGPVPTLLSLVDVEAGSGGVLLTWSGSGAASLSATVQRRTSSTEWQALGSPVSAGPDLLRYEDRSIVPGTRYAYRLAYRDESGEQFTAETWVDVPALALSLAGFRPNPAVGTPTVVFSLPDDRPARLEVIDVKGRVVHSREVGSLGGGSHVLPLASEAALPPGMYWIRLTHPERTLTTKGLVLR